MIARDPEQRSLYEARLKMERDARANLDYALKAGFDDGVEKGIEKGKMIGRVGLLRDLLREPSPTDAQLQAKTLDELAGLEAELGSRLRGRS